jgi:hypothetical protein
MVSIYDTGLTCAAGAEIEDPYGHKWGIATAKEKVSPREMARRMAAMHQPGGAQG